MKVINFIGQPGAGKSTLAAGLFYELKRQGVNAELVTEYTKDAIYENSSFVLADELLVFAEKYRRIKRLSPSVQVAVTDSPLINSLFYSSEFGDAGKAFFRHVAEMFDNVYVFVERVVPYVPHARMSDAAEADRMAGIIRSWLDDQGLPYLGVRGEDAALARIVEHLKGAGVVVGAPREE